MSEEEKEYPYQLGLALSGGGAKGLAHLGVMKALDELGMHPDIISGTSAGALAGVLYADGKDPEEILNLFKKKSFKEFAELTIPQSGLFKADRYKEFLRKNLNAKKFEDLKIPMRIVATDIVEGKSVIFDEGPLIESIMASCAYPIVFTPVKINNTHYVDGGLFKNFPVTPIRSDCKVVLGVNVAPLTKQEYKNSLLYIAERSFHYISISNSLLDRKLCDILIETNQLSNYALFALDQASDIFEIGYNIATEVLKKKKNLKLIEEL